jgi:hypothetical protein
MSKPGVSMQGSEIGTLLEKRLICASAVPELRAES